MLFSKGTKVIISNINILKELIKKTTLLLKSYLIIESRIKHASLEGTILSSTNYQARCPSYIDENVLTQIRSTVNFSS